jgi:hypothetical protein
MGPVAVVLPVPCQNSAVRVVSWGFGVGSGGLLVFVDYSAGDVVAAGWGVGRHGVGWVVVGWALLASLVGAVVIELPEMVVKNSRGVALVVDQDAVGALGS